MSKHIQQPLWIGKKKPSDIYTRACIPSRQNSTNLTGKAAPVKTELNELDWKSGLSEKSERLAQHISAFANQTGGGTFAFGVNDDASLFTPSHEQAEDILKKIGNIARPGTISIFPFG